MPVRRDGNNATISTDRAHTFVAIVNLADHGVGLELWRLEMKDKLAIEARETNQLRREALSLGIDIPRLPHWWLNDDDENVEIGVSVKDLALVRKEYLTDEGKAGVRKLIREEKRRNWEWRFKVVGSIITLVTGLLGTLIGVFAFLKK